MNCDDYYCQVNGFIDLLRQGFLEKQYIITNTLHVIHDVFSMHQIQYQVAFGSLLGLVRDGCQIPWDYDVDLMVLYRDRERIIAALNKELSKNYIIDCYENNPQCDSYKIRVTPMGQDPMFFHVDIFLLVPTDEKQYKKYAKKIYKYSDIRKYKTGHAERYPRNTRMYKLDVFLHKISGSFERNIVANRKQCHYYMLTRVVLL